MEQTGEACRGRRRGLRWRPVAYGLHVPVAGTGGAWPDLEAWALVLPPSGVFTHLTAAQVRGWWLPPLPADLPVLVDMCEADARPKRPGVRAARHPVAPAREIVAGLPLARPEDVLLASARDLGLLDLVVLLDSALHRGCCTVAGIDAVAARRRRGAPALRRALLLADGRSESPWESLLRVLHVSCDVPVTPQHEVRDAVGRFVGRGDLWLDGTRTLHEYDGAVHREARQHADDLRRERGLTNAGWVRRGYTARDLMTGAAQVLRDADSALGREHRPARLAAWQRLLDESLFTRRGTTRLRRRWGLPDP